MPLLLFMFMSSLLQSGSLLGVTGTGSGTGTGLGARVNRDREFRLYFAFPVDL